ncbi:hypothetical protein HYY75_10265 [bacterium]|nr:hypothetical protein [bacterium]
MLITAFFIRDCFCYVDIVAMKEFKWLFLGLLFFAMANANELSGLDLSAFQDFLNSRYSKSKPAPNSKIIPPLTLEPINNYPSGQFRTIGNANSQLENPNFFSLGGNKADYDALTLPPETRIPAGLRPLLTERKNPRQGISLTGNSGALLVPSPGVMEPGKSAVAVHAIPFELYDINDRQFPDDNYFDTSVKLVYGVFEGFELGIDKTFTNQDRYNIPEPTYVNAKYQVPGNITLGGSFCTDAGSGYSSAWVSAGVPVIWGGVGTNFGTGNFKFTYNGWDKLARGKYGGYNYKYDRAEGWADPLFFMVGGLIPITNYTNFMYDFNGDRFSLGFRFSYQKIVHFDASYISDGDYERLPGPIAHKRLKNFIFGGSIVF